MDRRNVIAGGVAILLCATLAVVLAYSVNGRDALAQGPRGPATLFLQGRVYEGDIGYETKPLSGVVVSLYGANNPYPDQGTFIVSATTDATGWYGLPVREGYEFYSIQETDPPGYISVGATTVSGTARTANWIEFVAPLTGKTLTGNKFWDRQQATATPTPTSRVVVTVTTPMPTQTPTRVMTGTTTPTPTVTRMPTRTRTPTPTATATLPATCLELLINGNFEAGSLLPWVSSGAVRLGPGHNSAFGAWLGETDNASGELLQAVAIPAGANPVRLSFWWLAEAAGDQPSDALVILAQHGGQADVLRTLPAIAPLGEWRHEAIDLTAYAGQQIGVTFLVHTDAGVPSTFRVDDVSLQACGIGMRVYLPLILAARPAPPQTPTATRTPTRTPSVTPTVTRPPATATPTPPAGTATATATIGVGQVMTLTAVADAWVEASLPQSNHGATINLRVSHESGGNVRRSLVRFDLSGIPPGATVDHAALVLRLAGYAGPNLVTIDAYDVIAAWEEMSVTWENQPSHGSLRASQSVGIAGDYTWDLTALVAAWLAGSQANQGILLRGPETGEVWVRSFFSREGDIPPRLIITHH